MDYILQTQGLTKVYGKVKALDNLNMNVPQGSIYGFVGRNGSGKTTLMRVVAGLIFQSSGEYSLYFDKYGCRIRFFNAYLNGGNVRIFRNLKADSGCSQAQFLYRAAYAHFCGQLVQLFFSCTRIGYCHYYSCQLDWLCCV